MARLKARALKEEEGGRPRLLHTRTRGLPARARLLPKEAAGFAGGEGAAAGAARRTARQEREVGFRSAYRTRK